MSNKCVCVGGILLCLGLGIVLTGCRTTGDSSRGAGSAAASRETMEKELRQKPFVIGVDDIVQVYVRYNPEVSAEFTVTPEGTIFVPLIGDVEAAGLTKVELQNSLTEKLSKFIINPEVTIGLSQYRSKRVYVIGEVTVPGAVPMRGNVLTVWDAIVAAGLPLRTAALWRVHVITPDVEDPVVKRINLRSIMYGGKLAHNDFLKPGDIVVVPSTVAASLGSYLGGILTPASQVAFSARNLAVVYEFFKNRSYFLDPLYGRFPAGGT